MVTLATQLIPTLLISYTFHCTQNKFKVDKWIISIICMFRSPTLIFVNFMLNLILIFEFQLQLDNRSHRFTIVCTIVHCSDSGKENYIFFFMNLYVSTQRHTVHPIYVVLYSYFIIISIILIAPFAGRPHTLDGC